MAYITATYNNHKIGKEHISKIVVTSTLVGSILVIGSINFTEIIVNQCNDCVVNCYVFYKNKRNTFVSHTPITKYIYIYMYTHKPTII